jgi:ATP synthase protein I
MGGFGMAESDQDRRARLEALEAKLADKRKVETPKRHQDDHHSQAQMAWRMVIELVTGLLLGFGIGYGLDALFGTIPWLMIVFTLLGMAAGIKTMLRSAKEMQAPETSGETSERD